MVLRALAALVELLDLRVGGVPARGVFAQVLLDLLVDGGVHEHRQDHRRGAVDGHGDAGGGGAQVEAGVELLHVVEGGDVDAGVADLSEDVGAAVRVFAVEGDGVEGGGEAGGFLAEAEVVEAAVGAFGGAFAGEHAGRILTRAAVGVDAAGVGVGAGEVFLEEEFEEVAPVAVGGGGDFRDFLVAHGVAVVVDSDDAVADGVFVDGVVDGFVAGGPVAEEFQGVVGERGDGVVVALAQGEQAAVCDEFSPSAGRGVGGEGSGWMGR